MLILNRGTIHQIMIKILTYNEINPTAWQELVDSSLYATWFQTPEAYAFYASNPDEMTPFAYAVAEDSSSPHRLKALCVGYVHKDKNWLWQRMTCRAIIIGGPVLADDVSESEVEAMLMAVRKHIYPETIYIESRNFHDYSIWKSVFQTYGFQYQPHLNIQVACDATHSMSEQRQRQVKKAIKNGATIVQATSEEEIKDWYKILHKLYRTKVRTPLFSEAFYLSFYRQKIGKYLLVKFENKVIGGMMCPVFAGNTIYEWYVCGMDEEYKDLYPSVMATHAAIEYAKVQGITMLDFMGAGKPNVPYGVREFKMEFGGELVEHGRFLCIRKPLLYKIGEWGVKWLKRDIYS